LNPSHASTWPSASHEAQAIHVIEQLQDDWLSVVDLKIQKRRGKILFQTSQFSLK